MSSTSIQSESRAARKYAPIVNFIKNAMRRVIDKSRWGRIRQWCAAWMGSNSVAAHAPASKWLRVAIDYLIIERAIDYLLDLILGQSLEYLSGVQTDLPALQEYYPYMKMVASFIVDVARARVAVLLRKYFSGRFGLSIPAQEHRSSASLSRVRRRDAVDKNSEMQA